MKSDAHFAGIMKNMGVDLARTLTGLASRTPPTGWTWHHDTSPGIIHLFSIS